uniref:Uncharacterized protein n=1 Tax=Anopheles coluzzii TaxID=1518534 RepID=A0A8W7PSU2_ANOCL
MSGILITNVFGVNLPPPCAVMIAHIDARPGARNFHSSPHYPYRCPCPKHPSARSNKTPPAPATDYVDLQALTLPEHRSATRFRSVGLCRKTRSSPVRRLARIEMADLVKCN